MNVWSSSLARFSLEVGYLHMKYLNFKWEKEEQKQNEILNQKKSILEFPMY
jgi:hypothetical protein